MLTVTLRANQALYAIDAKRIVSVVPNVELRAVPHAPRCVAGLLHYRGRIVPVVDLGLLLGNERCHARLSTRIIVVECSVGQEGQALLGLIAEDVSDVKTVSEHNKTFPALEMEQAAYLGPLFQVDEELIQLILVEYVWDGPLRVALQCG